MIMLIIGWYVIGVIGGLILSYYDGCYRKVTVMDLLMSLTFGGICGLGTLIIAVLAYHQNGPDDNFLNKKIF